MVTEKAQQQRREKYLENRIEIFVSGSHVRSLEVTILS